MLLEHNIDVYNQLNETLKTNNCACVIMGTGVGKSYVTLEYLTENNYNALIVSPRHSINKSWEKLCGDKVDTITYQKLANIYKEIDFSKYDLLICDEVHHVGAPTWGKPIKYLIDNKIIKIIGLTESSIRYSDGGRDVAEEFFNGNVAIGESVPSAIEKRILNPVTYVGAMYNSDGLKKTLRGKIQSRLYAKLNLVLNNTPTVEEIIKKNMPAGNRKGIIFASTIDDIKFAVQFIKNIYPNVEIRTVHSKQSDVLNERNMDWFKSVKEGYLCSVDMISEGVHIKGVNTLIMLRRTESVNLFNQQLGRCLDASTKEPAILFDLVNNKYSIRIVKNKIRIKTNNIFNSGSLNIVASEQLIVNDYTKDIVEVLREIENSLSDAWSEEEEKILLENRHLGTKVLCQLLPKRTQRAIYTKIHIMGLSLTGRKFSPWSDKEIEILKKYYPTEFTQVYKRLPNRSENECKYRATALGLVSNINCWSEEEEQFLRDNYKKMSLKQLSDYLGRSEGAVSSRIYKLGIVEPVNFWSEEEDEIIRKYYPTEGYSIVSRLPGRTKKATGVRARYLNVSFDNQNKFSKKEIDFIEKNYTKLGPSGCAEKLGRKAAAVQNLVYRKFKNLKYENVPEKWTEEEIETVRKYYPLEGYKMAWRLPNRTKESIIYIAKKYKIRSK